VPLECNGAEERGDVWVWCSPIQSAIVFAIVADAIVGRIESSGGGVVDHGQKLSVMFPREELDLAFEVEGGLRCDGLAEKRADELIDFGAVGREAERNEFAVFAFGRGWQHGQE
jgi:hypothetical protein